MQLADQKKSCKDKGLIWPKAFYFLSLKQNT